jgi:excisionase family DNA binding protein
VTKLSHKSKPSRGVKSGEFNALQIDDQGPDSEQMQQAVPLERFVDADVAAEFLMVKRKTILDWARAGVIPAHPFGRGKRVVWRFRISEIAGHSKRVRDTMNSAVLR